MALAGPSGGESWYEDCEACCHMALVFAVIHLSNI